MQIKSYIYLYNKLEQKGKRVRNPKTFFNASLWYPRKERDSFFSYSSFLKLLLCGTYISTYHEHCNLVIFFYMSH